jgi:hypothetical protein
MLTEQDIKNGKQYVSAFYGGWIPVNSDFTELATELANCLKGKFGEDWFNREEIQRIIDPKGDFTC